MRMETNYEKIIENIIRGLVNEACLNSETYSEAKLYIDMNISNTELGLMIKKIAHDKIEYLAMNRKINGQTSKRITEVKGGVEMEVKITIANLDEYKELIEKTKIQVEKLEECLSQLANFEFDVLTE